jgi:hypothetical protein
VIVGTLNAVRWRDTILVTEKLSISCIRMNLALRSSKTIEGHTACISMSFLQYQNADVMPWPSKSHWTTTIKYILEKLNVSDVNQKNWKLGYIVDKPYRSSDKNVSLYEQMTKTVLCMNKWLKQFSVCTND